MRALRAQVLAELVMVPTVPWLQRHWPMSVEPVAAVEVPLGHAKQLPTLAAPDKPL